MVNKDGLAHIPQCNFLGLSQLTKEHAAPSSFWGWRVIQHNTVSALSRSHLYTCIYRPGLREAIMVSCLAQGHKCYNWESNPHFDDSATKVWVWRSNSTITTFTSYLWYLNVALIELPKHEGVHVSFQDLEINFSLVVKLDMTLL